ncbi:MDS1 and EVI1 complex locus protein EVI1 [Dirofilaria immitis]|nr:MDS1 and EVI1 complex locus protein EVI1 [Dirofilaria immitis]
MNEELPLFGIELEFYPLPLVLHPNVIRPADGNDESENCHFCSDQQQQSSSTQHHQAAAAYQCQLCPKSFSSASGLKQHSHIHCSSKPFRCHICDKAYTQFSNLCRHKRIHLEGWQCQYCSASLASQSALIRHRSICEPQMTALSAFYKPIGRPINGGSNRPRRSTCSQIVWCFGPLISDTYHRNLSQFIWNIKEEILKLSNTNRYHSSDKAEGQLSWKTAPGTIFERVSLSDGMIIAIVLFSTLILLIDPNFYKMEPSLLTVPSHYWSRLLQIASTQQQQQQQQQQQHSQAIPISVPTIASALFPWKDEYHTINGSDGESSPGSSEQPSDPSPIEQKYSPHDSSDDGSIGDFELTPLDLSMKASGTGTVTTMTMLSTTSQAEDKVVMTERSNSDKNEKSVKNENDKACPGSGNQKTAQE